MSYRPTSVRTHFTFLSKTKSNINSFTHEKAKTTEKVCSQAKQVIVKIMIRSNYF